MRRMRIQVFGRVQGVFFRASTRERAQELGVVGWVKNLPDGSVEALIEGPAQDVEALINWAHGGPERAEVQWVEIVEDEGVDEASFSGFQVKR